MASAWAWAVLVAALASARAVVIARSACSCAAASICLVWLMAASRQVVASSCAWKRSVAIAWAARSCSRLGLLAGQREDLADPLADFLMRRPVSRRLPGGGQLGPQPLRLAQRAGQLLFQVGDLAASVFGEIVDVAPVVAAHRDVEHFAEHRTGQRGISAVLAHTCSLSPRTGAAIRTMPIRTVPIRTADHTIVYINQLI